MADSATSPNHRRTFDWADLRSIPIVEVAIALGLQIPRSGMLSCPFSGHADRTPSFHVDVKSNTCRCYGCGRGGSPIDLVAELLDLKIVGAAQWLASFRAGFRGPIRSRAEPRRRLARENPFKADPDVYGWLMANCPLLGPGRAYLNEIRCIADPAIETFGTGEVDRADLVLRKLVDEWGMKRVEACGLVSRYGNLIFPDQTLLFPFRNAGVTQYIQGRYFGIRRSVPKWISLNGVTRIPYNVEIIHSTDQVYICEGVLDVLSAFELGLKAFGLLGAQMNLPREIVVVLRGKSVYIVPDNDDAGRMMADRLSRVFLSSGIDHVIQPPPTGNDLNEYLVKIRTHGK